ncbi:hypothetical protein FRC10_000844 [Ceratobasidium sp. 414]|nr:hypothetical protein FRC10_000844 [Ceratobasidium sp. 414]
MGTSGYVAYLYKGRYYATSIHSDAFPDYLGDWFAAKVPRDEAERESWMKTLIGQIEQEIAWRHAHDIGDDEELEADYPINKAEASEWIVFHEGRELLFREIVDGTKWKLFPGRGDEEWTYVIDLDSRAFTINTLMHFRLDNMPSRTLSSCFWLVYTPGSGGEETCIPTFAHPPSTPVEHIATVARWPLPDFDISQAHEGYAKLAPVILSTDEWGAPTWTGLTVAQQLSADLVQTVLLDNAETLSNPDMNKRHPFGVCCWQLLSAAAPCHLKLPAQTEGDPHYFYTLSQLKANKFQSCLTPHYDSSCDFFGHEDLDHRYHWFRGCLVAFCPRLDVVQYVEHETVQMVENLRKYGRTTGIGIAFSGRHILAVAVDGDTVHCSHPLLFHDAKSQCQTGFLLATHLLSPLLAADKTPWLGKPLPNLTSTARVLPRELVQRIMFQLDHDTFQEIHTVSHVFRELYVSHPRIGDYFLLSYIADGNYRVFDTTTSETTTMHLQRCGRLNACNKDLARSFQHVHPGPHNLDPGPDRGTGLLRGHDSEHEVRLLWHKKYREGEGWPKVRLQAVNGIWRFVKPAEAKSNFPKALEYNKDRDKYQDSSSYRDYRWEEFGMGR